MVCHKVNKVADWSQDRFPANLIHDNSEEVRECFPETKSGGAQNGSKIKTTASIWHSGNKMEMDGAFYDSGNASRFFKSIPQGRFPANLIHDNSEEVRECFPETHSSGNYTRKTKTLDSWFGGTGNIGDVMEDFDNGGNASRFFKSIIYQAKASKSERWSG
jgi:hypothetical protein